MSDAPEPSTPDSPSPEQSEEAQEQAKWEAAMKELPFLIFLKVAGADGTMDDDEFNVFFQWIEQRKYCKTPYSRWLFRKTFESKDELLVRLRKGELNQDNEWMRSILQYINTRLPHQSAVDFNEDLERLATAIADASGSFFYSSGVSKVESAVLEDFHAMAKQELLAAQQALEAELNKDQSSDSPKTS